MASGSSDTNIADQEAVSSLPLQSQPLSGLHLYSCSSPPQSHNQGSEEDNEKDKKQNLCNPCGSASNATKAEHCGNERNDQKRYCPT
jgi:hypothetical protein